MNLSFKTSKETNEVLQNVLYQLRSNYSWLIYFTPFENEQTRKEIKNVSKCDARFRKYDLEKTLALVSDSLMNISDEDTFDYLVLKDAYEALYASEIYIDYYFENKRRRKFDSIDSLISQLLGQSFRDSFEVKLKDFDYSIYDFSILQNKKTDVSEKVHLIITQTLSKELKHIVKNLYGFSIKTNFLVELSKGISVADTRGIYLSEKDYTIIETGSTFRIPTAHLLQSFAHELTHAVRTRLGKNMNVMMSNEEEQYCASKWGFEEGLAKYIENSAKDFLSDFYDKTIEIDKNTFRATYVAATDEEKKFWEVMPIYTRQENLFFRKFIWTIQRLKDDSKYDWKSDVNNLSRIKLSDSAKTYLRFHPSLWGNDILKFRSRMRRKTTKDRYSTMYEYQLPFLLSYQAGIDEFDRIMSLHRKHTSFLKKLFLSSTVSLKLIDKFTEYGLKNEKEINNYLWNNK